MKRWPVLLSFLLFVGLCASVTFWAMQFMKPASRPVALPKTDTKVQIDPEAVIALFGGRAEAVATVSNFQLRGVVVAKRADESVAILSADSKPAEAIRVNTEVAPGVMVKEVHQQYVLLSEGGVTKKVELPVNAIQLRVDAPVSTVGVQAPPAPPPPNLPVNVPVGAPNLPAPDGAAPNSQDGAGQPPANPASPRPHHAGGRPNPGNPDAH
jgi:general secretion pathway protein C